jgi:hypothetical protein
MIKKKRREAGLSEVKRPRHNRSLLSVDSGNPRINNNNSAMSLQSENSYQSAYFKKDNS